MPMHRVQTDLGKGIYIIREREEEEDWREIIYYLDYLYGLYFLYYSIEKRTGNIRFVINSVESWYYEEVHSF